MGQNWSKEWWGCHITMVVEGMCASVRCMSKKFDRWGNALKIWGGRSVIIKDEVLWQPHHSSGQHWPTQLTWCFITITISNTPQHLTLHSAPNEPPTLSHLHSISLYIWYFWIIQIPFSPLSPHSCFHPLAFLTMYVSVSLHYLMTQGRILVLSFPESHPCLSLVTFTMPRSC